VIGHIIELLTLKMAERLYVARVLLRLGYIILERENRKALMSMEKHPLPSMKMMYILPGEKCKVCNGKYERRAV
jgi:hypothetical protein